MGKIADDRKFGKRAETLVKGVLETKFGELTQDPHRYASFDFFNDDFYVEHKQRNIPFGRFDSLMLERSKYDKYLKYKEQGKRCFIVWSLTNGRYVWEFQDQFIGDDAVFYEQVKSINRSSYTQVSDVINVFNEYIENFDKFII